MLQWSSVLLFTRELTAKPWILCVCERVLWIYAAKVHIAKKKKKKRKKLANSTQIGIEASTSLPRGDSANRYAEAAVIVIYRGSHFLLRACRNTLRIYQRKFSAVANCRRFTEGTAEEAKDILMPGLQKLFDKKDEKEDDKKGQSIWFSYPFLNGSSAWISISRLRCSYLLLLSTRGNPWEMLQYVVQTACSGAWPLRKCHFALSWMSKGWVPSVTCTAALWWV